MLLQATVKASAVMVYEPGRTGPTWRLVEAVPDATVKVFTVAEPDEGVAVMRMHCTEVGTDVRAMCTDSTESAGAVVSATPSQPTAARSETTATDFNKLRNPNRSEWFIIICPS
jgi:hypothetical protein